MKTRLVLYPFKMSSENGKKLSDALDALRVYPDGKYQPKDGDIIIDWGSRKTPQWETILANKKVLILNHWTRIALSINKIESFSLFKENQVPTPDWTVSQNVAKGWAKKGDMVCCRQQVEGMDGKGLVLAKSPDEVVDAKLYTKYMPIHKEFRVYVFGDQLLDVREKRKDAKALAEGKVDDYIRTSGGNWVYCEKNIVMPPDAVAVATSAVKALGLDFAGVDIIQAKADKKSYVLETNTAPYIGSHTVEKFVKIIHQKQQQFLQQL